jgi:hypothetical protein
MNNEANIAAGGISEVVSQLAGQSDQLTAEIERFMEQIRAV